MRISPKLLLFCGGIAVGAAIGSLPLLQNYVFEAPKDEASQNRKQPNAADESAAIKMSPDQMAQQDIRVAAVTSGTLQRHLIAPGTITTAADRVARVPARVVGTVAEMRKQLGDHVEIGEVVAVLDSREAADAKSDYLTARVNLDLQQTNYDRAKALWDRRVSAEAQYLQAQATFSETQLRLDLARQKLSALGLDARGVLADSQKEDREGLPSSLRKYELRASISGRIIERKVDVGTAVGKEGDPADVYAIADLSVMWADLSLPTSDLDQIKEGAAVFISPSGSNPEKRRKGKVIFVSPLLSPDTRSARVIAELPNTDGAWHPGAFVTAEIETSRDDIRLLVPRSALQKIEGNTVVFIRTGQGFERREVQTGLRNDQSVEVLSGLTEGDEIAIANSFLLKAELGKAAASDDD